MYICKSMLTWSMSRKSCETSTTPPPKRLIASASPSTASTSRWLVGSSRSRMETFFIASIANTIRDLRGEAVQLTHYYYYYYYNYYYYYH